MTSNIYCGFETIDRIIESFRNSLNIDFQVHTGLDACKDTLMRVSSKFIKPLLLLLILTITRMRLSIFFPETCYEVLLMCDL